MEWRQTAQDGVQFAPENYEKVGKVNAKFNMAGGNRADLLVKAPGTTGKIRCRLWSRWLESHCRQEPIGRLHFADGECYRHEAVEPSMNFIDKEHFPKFPEFLNDIPKGDVP